MIWIRVDANSKIGTGHLVRCLSIASALEEYGKDVCFILADKSISALLESKRYNYRVLYSAYDDLEQEIGTLMDLLKVEQPEFFIIDSYFVTEKYISKIRRYTKTIYIDDKFLFPCSADIIINYNIYGTMLPYKENAVVHGQQFFLGVKYAPLRGQFKNITYSVRENVQNVLLMTGGSNEYNLTGRILEEVMLNKGIKRLHYHVVSGMFNKYLPMLIGLSEIHPNIHIYQGVENMAELMRKCDVAITAGGSAIYEICAVGVPIICFSFVDNQEQVVETFLKRRLVCYGGNYIKEQEHLLRRVAQHLTLLVKNKKIREYYSKKEKYLVDGCGAERIAKELCKISEISNRKEIV